MNNLYNKLGCVVRMVIDSILLHAESRPNDHRKDAPLFTYWKALLGVVFGHKWVRPPDQLQVINDYLYDLR